MQEGVGDDLSTISRHWLRAPLSHQPIKIQQSPNPTTTPEFPTFSRLAPPKMAITAWKPHKMIPRACPHLQSLESRDYRLRWCGKLEERRLSSVAGFLRSPLISAIQLLSTDAVSHGIPSGRGIYWYYAYLLSCYSWMETRK